MCITTNTGKLLMLNSATLAQQFTLQPHSQKSLKVAQASRGAQASDRKRGFSGVERWRWLFVYPLLLLFTPLSCRLKFPLGGELWDIPIRPPR